MMSDLINHHTIYSFAMIAFSTGQCHQPVIVWCVTILLLCFVSPYWHCVVCHHYVIVLCVTIMSCVLCVTIQLLCCISSSCHCVVCHHSVIFSCVTILSSSGMSPSCHFLVMVPHCGLFLSFLTRFLLAFFTVVVVQWHLSTCGHLCAYVVHACVHVHRHLHMPESITPTM